MKELDNEFARIFYNKEIIALDAVLHTYIPYDEFVKILKYEFELIKFFSIKKCIIDLRYMKVYAIGNKEFINKIWFPKIIKLGIKCMAFIIPENLFAKVSMEVSHSNVNKTGTADVKYFDNEKDAKKWIKNYRIHY